MADPKKNPKATDVDLEEFLGEMVSIVKNKLDQQARAIDDLKRKVTALENRKNPESIIEEKLSEVMKSIGNVRGRLTSLEKKVKSPKTVSADLLKTLGGRIPKEETKETKEKK